MTEQRELTCCVLVLSTVITLGFLSRLRSRRQSIAQVLLRQTYEPQEGREVEARTCWTGVRRGVPESGWGPSAGEDFTGVNGAFP